VLASALLGEDPPTLPVRRLVRVAAVFGISENRARVALSRMAARGEVAGDGAGAYTLTGRLRERQLRLSAARAGEAGADDGTWHVVVLSAPPGAPAVRRARRAALRAARLGELREGTWIRPGNLAIELDPASTGALTRFRAVPDGDPAALAAQVFDLSGWARRADGLVAALDALDLDGDDALASGFELDADVLRHLQRDPLLPEPLLPQGWPGARLRARFAAFDRQYRERLAHAHRVAARSSRQADPAPLR
jgi:phenylacetic acid degradation operon negative regulatory protein